ncbi:MAG TPA: hypothetical protein VK589_29995 [Chryseolinea sp.]|nr:hypothetical protein [Chryseolinea sp.]
MLGLVATGKRSIKAGSQYDGYFISEVSGGEVILLEDGDVYDTLKQMRKIVSQTLPQTAKVSRELKGSTLEQTCRNIWNFLYSHVQYKKDHPLREQLRTPARTWKDRRAGVDCDCYSIFISSVLTNLKIPHSFRMAGYKGDFQHVYVVVPKNGRSSSSRDQYYAIDPVVNQFNFEASFTKKHDQKMSTVSMLNGLGECNPTPEILRLRKFVDTQEVIMRGGIPTKAFLDEAGISYAPAFDNNANRAIYVVSTPRGLLSVPTVISPAQSEELKTLIGGCVDPSTAAAAIPLAEKSMEERIKAAAKKFNWWWLAIIAGGYILLTGSDQQEVKSGLNGLAGSSKKKKALKVISI